MRRDSDENEWLRRLLEAGFFVLLIAILWTADTLTKQSELRFHQVPYDEFRLIAEQATSAIAVLLLVPALAWWLERFPLTRERPASTIAGHLLGTGLFATLHYFLMVGMRAALYPLADREYIFSEFWLRNLGIEYQKDLKIYLGLVIIIAAYRYFRRTEADAVQARPDRLIVQTGSGETVIRQDDIDYLEAARNYVVVGTAEREYLVRETLSKLERTLAPGQIVRTHRSWLVNIDRIGEIRSTDSGGYEIRLKSGKVVPLSRGYRDDFKSTITGQT